MTDSKPIVRNLKYSTFFKIAFRSLFLEASWNQSGQQNIGFAAAIIPGLKDIYRHNPKGLANAKSRIINFFNTNPVTSGLVIGAALKLEEKIADEEFAIDRHKIILNALSSTMASQGDQMFWKSWLPFCCLLGFYLTFYHDYPFGPFVIPILFCSLAWPVRFGGLLVGYRQGPEVHLLIKKYKIPQVIVWIQRIIALMTGVCTVLTVKKIALTSHIAISKVWFFTLFLAIALCLFQYFYNRRPKSLCWLYPSLLLILGIFFSFFNFNSTIVFFK